MLRTPATFFRAWRHWLFSAALLAAVGVTRGADTRPVVGPGATKDEVINAYGWPNGSSQLGTKEILNYSQGSVTLDNGRVERVDFLPNVPWQTPKPRPSAVSPANAKPAESGFDPWTTSFADAAAQAVKQHARILAAFTGSDWSPPSKRFIDEVATHPEFVNPLLGDFVFLKLDFPTRVALSPEMRKQNEELRARCGVTTYPSLVVLSPRGEPVATVDLSKPDANANYRANVITAVTEVRDLLKKQPVVVEPPKPAPSPPAPATPTPTPEPKPAAAAETAPAVDAALSTARRDLLIGLGGGALLVIAFLWWLWRNVQPKSQAPDEPTKNMFTGMGLGSVPTLTELGGWPVERVRRLAAGLFEEAGYKTMLRPDTDAELELTAADATNPTVLVCCWSGAVGPAHAKLLRSLSGAMVAGEIPQGWFISTSGFFDEARTVAQERGIMLIDGDEVIARLKQLPALGLRRVLARAGG